MAEFTDVNGIVSIRDSNGKPRLIVAADGGLRTRDSINENDGVFGGSTSSSGGTLFSLSQSAAVGDTTIKISGTPSGIVNGSYIAIGAFALNCELRRVKSLSSNTLTLNSALEHTHSSSAIVYVANDNVFSPIMFGADPATTNFDSWQALQQAIYQTTKLEQNAGAYGPVLDGGSSTFSIGQPLSFFQHTLRNISITPLSTFAPIDAGDLDAGGNAMCMSVARAHVPLTATAADDTFVPKAGFTFSVSANQPIVFNAMYGETLPGGITAGRIYYVKTATASAMTISATSGGATLDVTSDGGGWFSGYVGQLTKFWWDNVTLTVNLDRLNALIMGQQQPGEMKRTRVNMTFACTGTTYGIQVYQTQICRIMYPEFVINGATNCIPLAIGTGATAGSVTGVHVQDANFDGASDSGQTHIVIGGAPTCDRVVLSGITWLEGPGDAGIKIAGGRAIDLGELYCSGAPTNGFVYETGASASWKVGQMFDSGSDHINIKTADGVLFKTDGSADSVEQTSGKTFGGMRRANGQGPILVDRFYVSKSADYTARYIDQTIDVSAAGGARTITLRSAVGMSGLRQLIRKSETSANTVTVDAAGTETINGSLTYVIAGGAIGFVEIESNGTNWIIVNAS